MKLHVLKCPECNANIEIEEDHSFCYCQYCGCKILVDDEVTTINKNININRNSIYTKRYINEAEIIKEKSKAKGDKLVVILIVAMFLFSFGYFAMLKYSSYSEEKKLESIAEEVILDVKEGNYDDAYIKANTLHYTSGWSSDIEKKWDETRESLLEQIEKAKKEKDKSNSFFNWFD